MITKFNQYIKESIEDVYPDKSFKLVVTEDEEYVVYTNSLMVGVLLLPTSWLDKIIENNDIGRLHEREKHLSLEKVDLKKDYIFKAKNIDLVTGEGNTYTISDELQNGAFWQIFKMYFDGGNYFKEQKPITKEYLIDNFDIHPDDVEVVTEPLKFKEVEFQRGIMRKEKLNF